jgi:hypothetical protein
LTKQQGCCGQDIYTVTPTSCNGIQTIPAGNKSIIVNNVNTIAILISYNKSTGPAELIIAPRTQQLVTSDEDIVSVGYYCNALLIQNVCQTNTFNAPTLWIGNVLTTAITLIITERNGSLVSTKTVSVAPSGSSEPTAVVAATSGYIIIQTSTGC